MILPHIPPVLTRLRIQPDEPADDPQPVPHRRRGGRQPYADSTVAWVRRLIEQTTLSQHQIAEKTGVNRSTISIWTKNYGWTRPPFAPRAPGDVPRWRAGPGPKLRLLTGRLVAIAERMVRELEESEDTDLDKLVQALQVVKMARTTAMGNKRRPFLIGTARTGWQTMKEDEAIRAALREMHRRGVNIDRAPKEALDLVIDANTPMEEDHPALRPRGR